MNYFKISFDFTQKSAISGADPIAVFTMTHIQYINHWGFQPN